MTMTVIEPGQGYVKSDQFKFYSKTIQIKATCSIADTVTVTPLTMGISEATYTDITGTDALNSLQLQVLYFRFILS